MSALYNNYIYFTTYFQRRAERARVIEEAERVERDLSRKRYLAYIAKCTKLLEDRMDILANTLDAYKAAGDLTSILEVWLAAHANHDQIRAKKYVAWERSAVNALIPTLIDTVVELEPRRLEWYETEGNWQFKRTREKNACRDSVLMWFIERSAWDAAYMLVSSGADTTEVFHYRKINRLGSGLYQYNYEELPGFLLNKIKAMDLDKALQDGQDARDAGNDLDDLDPPPYSKV